jgi:hypothetical protein
MKNSLYRKTISLSMEISPSSSYGTEDEQNLIDQINELAKELAKELNIEFDHTRDSIRGCPGKIKTKME